MPLGWHGVVTGRSMRAPIAAAVTRNAVSLPESHALLPQPGEEVPARPDDSPGRKGDWPPHVDASDRLANVEQTARYKLPAGARVLVSRELRRLARVLNGDERLITLAQGRLDDATGLIAVTDRRVVFIGRQLIIEERVLHAQRAVFLFPEIKRVDAEIRALSGSVTIHQTGRKTHVTDVNPPERANEIAAVAKQRIAMLRKAKSPIATRSVPARGQQGDAIAETA